MDLLYYLNHEHYQKGDLQIAFKFAMGLCKKDTNIDTITLLVPQANNYDVISNELSIPEKLCKKHIVPNPLKKCLQVHTVKTYSPSLKFLGHDDCELLIAIMVSPKDLDQFVDKSRVKYWIVVPWLLSENKSFFEIHEAIDLETGEISHGEYQLDDRVKHAIEWLKSTSFPNECFNHPNDKERLKKMSNALSHYNVPLSYDAVVYYCLNNGIINEASHIIADHFLKAQQRLFAVPRHDYDFLKEMMDRTDW